MVVAVADMGITDHMCSEKFAFILYHKVMKINVRMGNKTLVPVLGKGMAVFSLNGKYILVWNVLHAPVLKNSLHSFCKHLTQRGCVFIGDEPLGVYLCTFPFHPV